MLASKTSFSKNGDGDASTTSGNSSSLTALNLLEQIKSGNNEPDQISFGLGFQLWAQSIVGIPIGNILSLLFVLINFLQLLPFAFTVDIWQGVSTYRDVVRVFRLQMLLANASLTAYIATFAVVFIFVIYGVVFSGYIAFFWRDEAFPLAFPMKLLRLVLIIFGKLLLVSTVGLGLSFFDCTDVGAGNFVLTGYSELQCWSVGHTILAVCGGIMTLFTLVNAVLSCFIFVSVNPKTKNRLCGPHFATHFYELICIVVLAAVDVPIPYSSVAWPIIQIGCFGLVLRSMLLSLPYYQGWVNRVQSGLYALLLETALVTFIAQVITYGSDNATSSNKIATIVGFILMPVAFFVGVFISHFRLYRLHGVRVYSREKQETMRMILAEPEHFEISTRFVFELHEPTEAHIEIAENLFQIGISSHPKSVWLPMLYCTFLSVVRGNVGRNEAILKKAQGLSSTFIERYFLFIQTEMEKQRKAASMEMDGLDSLYLLNSTFDRASSSLDEFERLQRLFFKTLSTRQVQPTRLQNIIASVANSRSQTEKQMTRLLRNYRNSAQILRLYGRYLNVVHLDPESSAAFFTEADRIETEAQYEKQQRSLFEVHINEVDDAVDRIISISRAGIIVRCTARVARMFGYNSPMDLIGQNVNMIAPPPHNVYHDSYLRRYQDGKSARLINRVRALNVQHASGLQFPAKLFVSNFISTGSTTEAFIGRILPVAKGEILPDDIANEPPTFAANDDGQITSFNQKMLNLLDTEAASLLGMSIFDLIPTNNIHSILDLEDSMTIDLNFKGNIFKDVTIDFSLIGNKTVHVVICTIARCDTVEMSPASPSIFGTQPYNDEDIVESVLGNHRDRRSSSASMNNPKFGEESPRIVYLADLHGVSTTELEKASQGMYTASPAASVSPHSFEERHVAFQSSNNIVNTFVANEQNVMKTKDMEDAASDDMGNAQDFKRMKQRSAISVALNQGKIQHVLQRGVQWIRMGFLLILAMHFCWFGGLWDQLEQRFEFDNGVGAGGIEYLPSQEIFELVNLGELIKHSQITCFYARLARSGSPQGLNGEDPLQSLVDNVMDYRGHLQVLSELPAGQFFHDTVITVQKLSGAGVLISADITLWEALQALAVADFLSYDVMRKVPASSEWLFIMLNGPAIIFDSLIALHADREGQLHSLFVRQFSLVLVAWIMEIICLILLIIFGIAPLSHRIASFRAMMMRVYLGVPRGACRTLSKIKESVTDWTAEKSRSGDDGNMLTENAESDSDDASEKSTNEAVSAVTASIWSNNNNNFPRSNLMPLNKVAPATFLENTITITSNNNSNRNSTFAKQDSNSSSSSPKYSMRHIIAGRVGKLWSSIVSRGEEVSVMRGKDICKFRIVFKERRWILGMALILILLTAVTYILYLTSYLNRNILQSALNRFYILLFYNHRLRFLTHELSGGWNLYPNLLEMQSDAMTQSSLALQNLLNMNIGDASVQYLLMHADCFADSCSGTPIVFGMDALEHYWLQSNEHMREYLIARNMSVAGNATSFVPGDNVDHSHFIIWDGIAQLDYGIGIGSIAVEAAMQEAPLRKGLHAIFLLALLLEVALMDFIFFKKIQKSMKMELAEGAFLLSSVPEYIGVVKMCDRERKKMGFLATTTVEP